MIYGHFRPRRHLMAATGYRRAQTNADLATEDLRPSISVIPCYPLAIVDTRLRIGANAYVTASLPQSAPQLFLGEGWRFNASR